MDGNIDSIQIKGIVRNLTTNGVEDGHSEDLINLRFKDGSWRTSGDGKLVFTMGHKQNDIPYVSQSYHNMYIHTNVYRHVLGIGDIGTTDEGFLTWFADIDADGIFNGRTMPEQICPIRTTEKITITQTGNLITVIADSGEVTYALFNERDQKYIVTSIDENGAPNARTLYPYGDIHFNLDCTQNDDEHTVEIKKDAGTAYFNKTGDVDYRRTSAGIDSWEGWHADMLEAFNNAQQKNLFTRPFLAMVAVKLYDGKYAFASAPTLLWTKEAVTASTLDENNKIAYMPVSHFGERNGVSNDYGECSRIIAQPNNSQIKDSVNATPVYASCTTDAESSSWTNDFVWVTHPSLNMKRLTVVHGADLLLHISDISILKQNPDLFTGIAVFITPEVDFYEMEAEPDEQHRGVVIDTVPANSTPYFAYCPKPRKLDSIRHDLINSPFFLLREFDINELDALQKNLKIDLTDPLYDSVLSNLTQQLRFPGEAIERKTIKPKVAYTYNGRLHLANYTSESFYGYPIDCFLFNNHNGRQMASAQDYLLSAFKEQLPNTIYNAPQPEAGLIFKYYSTIQFNNYQFEKNIYFFADKTIPNYKQLLNILPCTVAINCYSSQLNAQVTRYISPNDGGRDYIEDLPPLLCFSDLRYDKLEVIVQLLRQENGTPCIKIYRRQFDLKPFPSLNLSYFLADDLKPLIICDQKYLINTIPIENGIVNRIDLLTPASINNATEHYPNGLKVSTTDNPLSFPYKNTYQIGSAEIIALCSNAVAVGTGQTGAAPLYVFCKDGIYALLVDASGQMTYTNARIIARDVCNNHRSVTPIDTGVVFTTDRGLMIISGEQVQELSESVEGEPLNYVDISTTGSFTPKTAPLNIMVLISNQSIDYCDGVNFLRYIREAIINYNHNLRELIISDGYYVVDADMAKPMQGDSNIPHINTNNDPKQIGFGTGTSAHYSYVLDRYGNWKRYTFGANEFVSNYPTSYRIENGNWFKVDEEQNSVSDEADNGFFVCSRAIKLNSLDFKQVLRFVVRGFFNTRNAIQYYYPYQQGHTLGTQQTIVVTPTQLQSETSTAIDDGTPKFTTHEQSKQTQEIHITNLDVSDVQTFTIGQDNEADITITFPQNGTLNLYPALFFNQRNQQAATFDLMADSGGWNYWKLAPQKPSDAHALFDLKQNNHIVLAYQLIRTDTNQLIKEWLFKPTIEQEHISVNLDIEEQTVRVTKSGNYQLKLIIKSLDLFMTTNEGKNLNVGTRPFYLGEVQQNELTDLREQNENITISSPIQLNFDNNGNNLLITSCVNNPRLILNNNGYIDLVCDPAHNDINQKICHFDENYANDATLLIKIIDSNDNPIYQVIYEDIELIDQYTLRVYLKGEDIIYLLDTEDSIHSYYLELYLNSLNTKLICDIPATSSDRHSTSGQNSFTAQKNPRIVFIENEYINLIDSTDATEIRYELLIRHPNDGVTRDYSQLAAQLEQASIPVLQIRKVGQTLNEPPILSIPANIDRQVEQLVPSLDENNKITEGYRRRFFWGDRERYDQSNNILDIGVLTYPLDNLLEQGEEYYFYIQADDNFINDNAFAMLDNNTEVSHRRIDSFFRYNYEKDQYSLKLSIPPATTPIIKATLLYDTLPQFNWYYRFSNDKVISNLIKFNQIQEIITGDEEEVTAYVGAYVFGSYDGQKWALLGGKEKTGHFTDIGCIVERTDVRYIRYIIAGNVKGNSRIDGIEITTKPSTLNNKIR